MKKPPRYDGTQHCVAPAADAAAAFAGRTGSSPVAAKLLCQGCAFLSGCRGYALTEDVHGVWGGLTDDERRDARAALHLPEPVPVGDELDLLVLEWRTGGPVRQTTSHRPRTAAA